MGKKPWDGRFESEMDKLMVAFSESVSFDYRMAEVDIRGSIAHAKMLGASKIITAEESEKLVTALGEILEEYGFGLVPD